MPTPVIKASKGIRDFFRQPQPKAGTHAAHGEGSIGGHLSHTRQANPSRSHDGNALGVGSLSNSTKPFRLGG